MIIIVSLRIIWEPHLISYVYAYVFHDFFCTYEIFEEGCDSAVLTNEPPSVHILIEFYSLNIMRKDLGEVLAEKVRKRAFDIIHYLYVPGNINWRNNYKDCYNG